MAQALRSSLPLSKESATVEMICVVPPFSFPGFVEKVQALAARYDSLVKPTTAHSSRHLPRGVFISSTLPTVILRRDGRVVGQAVGDLTTQQLSVVLRAALR
jgi:hypothetical protein